MLLECCLSKNPAIFRTENKFTGGTLSGFKPGWQSWHFAC